jgi:aconitate decarboxylase
MAYVDRPQPATGLAGKFSFQYTAAAALLDGAVTVASFSDERRFAPDMVALLPRIEIRPDASRQGRFDAMTLAIEVEWDGGAARGDCDGPPGIWGRPVPTERLRNKARDCLSIALGPDAATEIVALADGFASLDRAGLNRLMACLAGPSRGAKAA